MSISAEVPGQSPSAVLSDAIAAVRGLAETLWSARSDAELIEVVGLVQQATSALAAVEAGAVVEVDARDLAKDQLHYGSTGDWLTHVGGLRRGEGKQRLARAKALTGPFERTQRALLDGTVSPGQADLIVTAVEALPPGDLVRRRGEKVLVRQAGHLHASELAKAGRHLAEVVDPDAVDRRLEAQLEREERAAHLDRTLSISPDRAGGIRIKGHGSAEDGELLLSALMPLTTPEPTVELDTGEAYPDPRDHGARLWDALVSIARHALDTHLPPETHGTPARLLVTVDHRLLTNGTTTHGVELPPGVLRRLACDAEVIPAVLGSNGEVLDVGRLRRLVTPAIWTALVIRDRHCTFPGCARPPIMCHAHHLRHWINGGRTSLDNLALLCGHHHRVIHHTPWEIQLSPDDQRPEFRPPPKPGVEPEWIRYRPRRD